MYENDHIIKLRSIARRIGLTKVLSKFFVKNGYEILFDNALMSLIKENDVIFDIGANRGFYTEKFLKKVVGGMVYAFEPVPENNSIVSNLKTSFSNLSVCNTALGSKPGTFYMSIGDDKLKATSRITKLHSENDLLINVDTIDNIIEKGYAIPNVIKIDVEGFELEVIKGMSSTLRNHELHVIAIEVHFKLLEEDGFSDAPHQIVNILKQNEFKVKWVDPSHIIATRNRS